jgi:hypothetical protein
MTNQRVVGDATSVEVQLSRAVKVAGIVLEADRQHDVAVVRIDPAVMASIKPVPLGCPRTGPARSSASRRSSRWRLRSVRSGGWTFGTVSRVDTRTIASDLTLAAGGTGGPAFTAAGEVAGITTLPNERDEPKRGATTVVRIEQACDVMAAAAKKVTSAPTPSGAHLPVEPTEPAPVAQFKEAVRRRAGNLKPYQMATADFDVGFIPPILNYAAQSLSNGDFSNWSEYMADVPPVLVVRVTPKMVESLLGKVARGAASTQGWPCRRSST